MLNMLVVEENFIFRQMLVESLRPEFPDLLVLEAKDGKEAVRVAVARCQVQIVRSSLLGSKGSIRKNEKCRPDPTASFENFLKILFKRLKSYDI